jgi:hypothetical protein
MVSKNKEINYDIRVSKTIERKMMVEAFNRLSVFSNIASYRYVGMGSYYFTDFRLFHRSLGISDMISIEWDRENEERFKFNSPFKCIKIKFGSSWEVIPTLSWEKKTILWLDYDRHLDSNKLLDVKEFCGNAMAGSVILVTLSAAVNDSDDDGDDDGDLEKRLEKIKVRIGPSRVPPEVTKGDLRQWGTAKVYRGIIDTYIRQVLNDRNGGLPQKEKLLYKQLFNFHYSDGVKMVTIGGLIYNEDQSKFLDTGIFDNLDFVRNGEDPYSIEQPTLTYRELQYLDSELPVQEDGLVVTESIPPGDIDKYRKLYRYFPAFTEASL